MNLLDLFVKIGIKDEASGKMESLSASMIAKGQVIANGITSAIGKAVNAIRSIWDNVIMGALDAYGNYEQLAGGIETFFGSAADTVIANAKNAYQTAGMSANQYMSDVSSFAMALVTSVSKSRESALKQDTDAQKKALNQQLSDLQKSLAKQTSAKERELSKGVSELRKALAEEVEAQREANQEIVEARSKQLAEQYKRLQESIANENKAFKEATSERIKEINREYTERLKLVDAEEYKRIKAIDDQIDALNGQTEAEREAIKKRQQLEKIANLQYKIANETYVEDREKAQKELDDYLEQIEQENREKSRRAQIERYNEEKKAIQERYDLRREQIKTQQSAEIEAYQAQREREYEIQQKANQRKLKEEQESNQRILKELQKSMSNRIKSMQEANQAQVEAEQERANLILDEMRESNDQQLDQMREYVAEQTKLLEKAADTNSGYVKATAEDQKRAADLADMAMRDIADNVNKMGSSMESVQDAYQGFAKANFTMLDNLKLGYSGTKEGMENLLNDAEKVQAKYGEMRDYSVDSFADIVEAIHVMQVEMGISGLSVDELRAKLENNDFTAQEIGKLAEAWYGTSDAVDEVRQRLEEGGVTVQDAMILLGTTAQEGATTYEGAINRVKAAWENWLTSLTDPEQDVGESTRNLMEEVGNAAAIIIPRVGEILHALWEEIKEKAPEIFETLKNEFLDSLPPEWREKLEGFIKGLEDFHNGAKPVLDVLDAIGRIFSFVGGIFQKVGNNIGVVLADLVSGFEGTANVGGTAFYDIGAAVRQMGEFFDNVGKDIGQFSKDTQKFFSDIAGTAGRTIGEIVKFFSKLPQNIVRAIGNVGNLLYNAGVNIINGFWNGLTDTFKGVQDWVLGIGDWIAGHKGPKEYDRKLLVPNGSWISEGLYNGLEGTFSRKVMPFVTDMADSMEDAFGTPTLSAEYNRMVSARNVQSMGARQPTMVTAILELDRTQLGRVVFQLNGEESQRVGVNLMTEMGVA